MNELSSPSEKLRPPGAQCLPISRIEKTTLKVNKPYNKQTSRPVCLHFSFVK